MKIITLNRFNKVKDKIKDKNKVLVGGCFDLFHYGHLVFLKKARQMNDYLIVALESDKFIKKRKGRKPIHNQRQRAEVLAAINYVDLIIMLPYLKSDEEYFNLVKLIRPKLIAVTVGDPLFEKKKRQAKEIGGKIKIVSPLVKSFSTKKLINNFDSD